MLQVIPALACLDLAEQAACPYQWTWTHYLVMIQACSIYSRHNDGSSNREYIRYHGNNP